MENKGLSVFNTKLVLVRSDISTDFDFKFVDRTVAHEYFHNWTGNRVTCRDWFQLSLKEGLTVFREQQYAGDRYSPGGERIQTVRNLRSSQFPEDAGPMAHPVRPQSYQQISNFYTSTVYQQGRRSGAHDAHPGRRVGLSSRYRSVLRATRRQRRHDRRARSGDARCEWDRPDSVQTLVRASRDAESPDRGPLRRSVLDVRAEGYAELPADGRPTREASVPPSIHRRLARCEGAGDLRLQLDGEPDPQGASRVLSLRQPSEVFRFVRVPVQPVPSLGRNFSAPVIIRYDYTDEALRRLLSFDSDAFNRWEAGQRLAMKFLLQGIADHQNGREIQFPAAFARGFGRVLEDDTERDPAFVAEVLALPAEVYLGEQLAGGRPRRDPSVTTGAAASHRRSTCRARCSRPTTSAR